MKHPQVRLAQYFPFLAIRTDLNGSRIRESVQVQTAQELRGPEFQDLFSQARLKKPSPSRRRPSFDYAHQERVTERNTANSASK
jgi:hypothetical protein